ncbi:MAG: metallophosphoesterase family protein [Thiolinea sp.]
MVAYCAEPEATVALMRAWGVPVVMGNCEEALGQDAGDCGCGFAAGSTCALLSDSWYNYCQRYLSENSKAWMRSLPRTLSFRLGGLDFQVVHGSLSSINRFIFASTPGQVFADELQLSSADAVIGGHAGLPFVRAHDKRYWLNSGVIGMPANDGTARTWYLQLCAQADGVQASWQSLTYDAKLFQAAMHQHGLAQRLCAKILLSGLWPSEDILPATERAQRGLALHPQSVTLRPRQAVYNEGC